MSNRAKRLLEDFDPNASDPEDGDYGGPGSRQQRRTKHRKSSGSMSRPRKRQRQTYGDTDDEIDDDSDEVSEASFEGGNTDEEEVEVNPATGRRVRNAAKKVKNYEEQSEDDIEDTAAEEEEQKRKKAKTASRTHNARKSPKADRRTLIVKLPVALATSRELRSRTGGKAVKRPPSPERVATRRSSRLSHDEQTMYSLTGSGRHLAIQRPNTRSPELQPAPRPTRGSKGVKKPPSAIMEASQEASVQTKAEDDDDEGDNIHISQAEPGAQEDDEAQVQASDAGSFEEQEDAQDERQSEDDDGMEEGVVQESVHGDDADEEDEDEGPVTRRNLRARRESANQPSARSSRRGKGVEESSDFEPNADDAGDEDAMSNSDDDEEPPRKTGRKQDTDESSGERRSRRLRGRERSSQRRRRNDESDDQDSEIDQAELAEEAEELAEDHASRRRKRRAQRGIVFDEQPNLRNRGNRPDYRIFRPELALPVDDDDVATAATPQRKGRNNGSSYRSLFSVQGPFGGGGGPPPLLGGPLGAGATGGVDSDSSDDEAHQTTRSYGGTVGMTPTSAAPLALFPQTHNSDPIQGVSGGPAGLGKVKDKKALADADPLGVDQNVNFDGVGGLDGHINQLKEMVMLPLLYPEVFMRFHVTPPRGVLFHGPPGTGKTLLARALASSVSSQGKKVTFYMRKGADALSKWVGEAERQLRLLFEEARKNQPSIIFFDEIDGLAPVRSSKQEQIHASIVATLLALMDGMDGRGQVIVIGATNRPDTVDPALRRPGRFDREFYFPLPNQKARRAIIDIHTKGWDPPLRPEFKDQLAELTKGYGGADLRALCTEAALNAVQGTYPQIYQSTQKLIIDPSTIKVLAKDFMISVNKMVPSSERSTTSAAAPLPKGVEPLLRDALDEIAKILEEVIPQKKKLTALEEAQYDDRDDEYGFARETMQRDFERARIFRPRLLIHGLQGMGQQYLGAAILHKYENLHVQAFDLPTLLEDSTRSPEAAVVQLFKEVRRHKPSVIYIPNVDIWYETVGTSVLRTFTGLLRSLPSNDPVLVLGIMETRKSSEKPNATMLRDLFGFSSKNRYLISRPGEAARHEFFGTVIDYIRTPPSSFPDLENRRKRDIPRLEVAPIPESPKGPTKEELKAQKKKDRLTLNVLKMQIQPIMDMIKTHYKRFRTPIIDDNQIQYLYDEQNPTLLSTDLPPEERQQRLFRPYELGKDNKGVPGLVEVASGKFYYNLDIVMIEKRLSNGYYKRPKDFLADIKRLAHDARVSGDVDRTLKANELQTNVEVDIAQLENTQPALATECEAVYKREQERENLVAEKARIAAEEEQSAAQLLTNVPHATSTTDQSSGPVVLGERVPGAPTLPPVTPVRLTMGQSSLSNGFSASIGRDSHSRQSNGFLVPSRIEDDVHMADSQEASLPHGRPVFIPPSTPSLANTQTQRSQKSALTHMAHGSQPADYQNSASTTTSGQKTSDRSHQSSGPLVNTQSTNGIPRGSHPDFSAMMPLSGGSQLPDTQEAASCSQHTNSQPSQPSSGGVSHPQRHSSNFFKSVLNAASISRPHDPANNAISTVPSTALVSTGGGALGSTGSSRRAGTLILDESSLSELHRVLVQNSSGLSVEQLQQVGATLMDAIWQTKNDWNRDHVTYAVSQAFNTVIADIEAVQKILPPSQSDEDEDDDVPMDVSVGISNKRRR